MWTSIRRSYVDHPRPEHGLDEPREALLGRLDAFTEFCAQPPGDLEQRPIAVARLPDERPDVVEADTVAGIAHLRGEPAADAAVTEPRAQDYATPVAQIAPVQTPARAGVPECGGPVGRRIGGRGPGNLAGLGLRRTGDAGARPGIRRRVRSGGHAPPPAAPPRIAFNGILTSM